MGAQGSTLRDDGGDDSDVSSASANAGEPQQDERVEVVTTAASVVETVTSRARAVRPPVAPQASNSIVDRVVAIQGTIKRAYPLQWLLGGKDANTGDDDDEDMFGVGDFSVGSGPCGRDATQVVSWEVQLQGSYETCYVFLYDKWAETVSHFQRHYKVHVRGLGLVAIDHWDIGHDTEEVKRCYVVAEALLLKRTMERSPKLLPKAQGVTIEIAFEEPQRVPESEQIRYLPEQVIHARDVYGDSTSEAVVAKNSEKPTKKNKKTPLMPSATAKSNPRGKRTLREMDIGDAAGGKITTPSAYMYTKLAELIPGNANVYGVVVNMSLPKRSEGHDFYMSLHLVDESCPKREDALQVMVFLPTLDQMPRVLHVGDVVRFHKIRINRYQDRLQGVCNSRATRYLVLRRGRTGAEKIEQQTSSASWTFEKYDKERFHQLTKWADRALRDDVTLPPGCPQPSRPLGEMQFAESFADVVVRVLHVQEPYEDFTVGRLIIWDGSGSAASCRDLYEKLRREHAKRERSVPFIPESGLLMEVVVDSCWIVMETMGFQPELTNHWCRFRNLAVSNEIGEISPGAESNEPVKSWYELHFREVSSVMLVPEDMAEVQARVRQLSPRIRQLAVAEKQPEEGEAPSPSTTARSPPSKSIPVPPESIRVTTQVPAFITDKVPATPIERILLSTQVPRKYHCFARVVQLWPPSIDQIAKPKTGDDRSIFVYSFVMRLQDPTGQLDVIVHGDDAEKFLHGIPPCDLTKNQISRSLVQKRLSGLLAMDKPAHFCIKSYKPKAVAPTDQNGSEDVAVRFRLFDTLLQIA